MRKKLSIMGEGRTREEFLLFPKEIDNEIRWLENAKWQERYDGVVWVGEFWINE